MIVNLGLRATETQYIPLKENNRPVKEFKITLTGSRGAAVPLTRFGRLIAAEPVFGPHDAYFNFWISRIYDLTTPGSCLITFSRSGVVKAAVISNTTAVKVVEPTRFNCPETSLDLPSSQSL